MRQMQGQLDSWAIRWNWTVFKADGLVLYPGHTLVENTGFDGSGTHCSNTANGDVAELSQIEQHRFPAQVQVDSRRFAQVCAAIAQSQGNWARRLARRLFHHMQRWAYCARLLLS